MKFSDRTLKSLKPRDARYSVWEDGVHGLGNLGVRVTPTGRRSWIFMYRWGGKARMLTLGKYPAMSVAEAHKVSAEHQARLDAGEDPDAPVPKQDEGVVSVAQIGADYLGQAIQPGRTRNEFRRILKREVYPAWSSRPASSIHRREVVSLVDAIAGQPAPVMANRTLAVIKAMFNFAIRRGQVDVNPASLIPMKEEEARARYLEDDELRILFKKLPAAPLAPQTKLALLLTLATAQRPGEAVSIEPSELSEGWWTIPPDKRKVGRRGSGRRRPLTKHGVPLSPAGAAVLDAASAASWSDRWAFPSSKTDKHIREDALAKGVRRCQEHFGLRHWTPHDLRRTATTHLAKLRVNRTVLGKLLGHKKTDESVTAIYDQYTYDDEKVKALKKWSTRLTELGFLTAVEAIRSSRPDPNRGGNP